MSFFYTDKEEYYQYLYPDHISYSLRLFNKIYKNFGLAGGVNTVYDACCGTGEDLSYFKTRGHSVRGSDLSPKMVAISKKKLDIGESSGDILVSDVLDLPRKLDEKFDLVLFRGNTLGHLNYSDQIKAIRILLSLTKKSGFFLFDFRNGEKYFQTMGKYEKRGIGYNHRNKEFYLSYYKLKKTCSMDQQYYVESSIFLVHKLLRFKWIKRSTLANFVDKNRILQEIKPFGEIIYSVTSDEGLQCIESFLVKKY